MRILVTSGLPLTLFILCETAAIALKSKNDEHDIPKLIECGNETSETEVEKLSLTIYYETLCPQSIEFFRNQLIPTWEALGPKYLELRFVPYGNAHTFFQAGLIITGCPQGEMECFANMVHACSLEYLPGNVARDFIFCTMTSDSPPEAITNCTSMFPNELNFESDVMETCVQGFTGQLALALMGLQSLDFIRDGTPSVAINGVVAEGDEPFESLLSYICNQLSQIHSKSLKNPECFHIPTPCLDHSV